MTNECRISEPSYKVACLLLLNGNNTLYERTWCHFACVAVLQQPPGSSCHAYLNHIAVNITEKAPTGRLSRKVIKDFKIDIEEY